VEIDEHGWRLIADPPVRFRRSAGMRALPVPVRGGKIEKLKEFLNIKDYKDFVLVVAWMLAALRPGGPYPVLGLAGEQGTAKSFLTSLLRKLIDPNSAPLRALPREDRDLFITATNSLLLAFDNCSGIAAWTSDTLCRLSSGGGFSVRSLYTDGDETLFNEARPIILNGIKDIITRPDLADRSMFIVLEKIEKRARKAEKKLLAEFEKARPAVLGSLYDAVSCGLRELATTELTELPRMADFALWAVACETAFWEAGTFWEAYSVNMLDAVNTVLDADPVAMAIRGLMATIDPTYINVGGRLERARVWEGTATGLLDRLNSILSREQQMAKEWPKAANALSGKLRECAPGLREVGVIVTFDKEGHTKQRMINLCFFEPPPQDKGKTSSSSSAAETPSKSNGLDADDGADDGAMQEEPRSSAWPIPKSADDPHAPLSGGSSAGSSAPNKLKLNGKNDADDKDDENPTPRGDGEKNIPPNGATGAEGWGKAMLKKYPPEVTEACIDRFEERAAILEADGGCTREESERKAWDEVFGMGGMA
jgi:hypothetical protein